MDGERFFFVAPSKKETDHHLEAEHNADSNVFKLTAEIYDMNEKTVPPPRKTPKGATQWRGGGGQTRGGGGQTRGGGGQTRGYTGGSNFGADGYSEHVKTHQINVDPVLVDTVNLTLQLVNNESEEERVYQTEKIVRHIDANIKREVAKTAAELDQRFPGYSWQIRAKEIGEVGDSFWWITSRNSTPTNHSHEDQENLLV